MNKNPFLLQAAAITQVCSVRHHKTPNARRSSSRSFFSLSKKPSKTCPLFSLYLLPYISFFLSPLSPLLFPSSPASFPLSSSLPRFISFDRPHFPSISHLSLAALLLAIPQFFPLLFFLFATSPLLFHVFHVFSSGRPLLCPLLFSSLLSSVLLLFSLFSYPLFFVVLLSSFLLFYSPIFPNFTCLHSSPLLSSPVSRSLFMRIVSHVILLCAGSVKLRGVLPLRSSPIGYAQRHCCIHGHYGSSPRTKRRPPLAATRRTAAPSAKDAAS